MPDLTVRLPVMMTGILVAAVVHGAGQPQRRKYAEQAGGRLSALR
ncbi:MULTISPECIES: hypothetical protein [unclassified Mycobacterium]|nr:MULTISPECIES: hypothetical protein [unclassified Mycobacterium]